MAKEKQKLIARTITFPEDIHKWINDLSEKEIRSFNNMVISVLYKCKNEYQA